MAVLTELRLFYHLYEKVMSREITTFATLAEHTRQLQPPFKPEKVLVKAFYLLKELHWGIFKELDRNRYSQLWKELVLARREFPNCGDLKRNISISNIYVSLLDIHGYTRFCQESKSNLSRLRKLDEFLHEGIRKISAKNSSLANRERGDEIIVISASATSAIKTTLEILNTFSRRAIIKSKSMERSKEDYSIVLPDFKVTAGIAGGNLTTPLIITESGLLSGYLLNTAARLQTRANELSPRDSKVMVTKTVYANFLKENKSTKDDLYSRGVIVFFNNGSVTFKGMKIFSYEIIFNPKERYREHYEAQMEELFDSLSQKLWQQKVFLDLMAVIGQACRHMPAFSLEAGGSDKSQALTNSTLAQQCTAASLLYENDEDYSSAISLLGRIKEQIERVTGFDQLVRNYTTSIYGKYTELLSAYESRLDEEIDQKIDSIFNSQYKLAYYNSRKSMATHDKLKHYARRSKALANRKNTWYALVEENRDRLELEIYSGKK